MLSKACLLLLHFHFTSSSHLHTHCQSNLQLNILFTSFTSSVHLSYHTPVSGLGSDTFTVPVLVQCLSFYISKWYDDLVLNHHPSSLNTQHQSIGLLCTPPPIHQIWPKVISQSLTHHQVGFFLALIGLLPDFNANSVLLPRTVPPKPQAFFFCFTTSQGHSIFL